MALLMKFVSFAYVPKNAVIQQKRGKENEKNYSVTYCFGYGYCNLFSCNCC